jgi:uncharacterized protein DUF1194
MRLRLGLYAALILLAAVAVSLRGDADAAPMKAAAPERAGTPVDVELVLGVDISYSMDPEEQALQREGYIKALTSREFLQALRQGMHGKIAITYFEWAGYSDQRVVVPWRLIEGPESADAFVGEIAAAPYRRAARTSISGAIEFGSRLFDTSGYRGIRRVIDISGDGANNNGQLVTVSRDEAVGKGITINGLPIMLKRLNYATMDIEQLDVYYEDCVIGGPGAFVIAIADRDKFIEATKTKLVLEVANRMPPARVIPAAADKPRVSCTIGERLWQERWGN